MVEEAYVSFETAKLLKEKGFPQSTFRCHYITDGNNHYKSFENRCGFGDFDIIAPTQQMTMRWLREEHNVYINIAPTHNVVDGSINFLWLTYSSDYSVTGDCDIFYPTYEQAVEAAINYCLENLI